MPEKNCAYLSWALEGPRRGWMASCPVSRALLTNISPKARTGEKIGDSSSPLPPWPFPKISRGKELRDPAGRGQGAEAKGHPEFLLPWKRRIPTRFLSSPSSLSSFELQLPRPGFQPSLTLLLSPRKTPQLQTQVKQIFVAVSKFQRLFIAGLSAPGAKSCC